VSDPMLQPDMTRLVRADAPAAIPANAPVATYPSSPSPFLRSPLPPAQWTQPDNLRQFYKLGTPQTRVPPLQLNAQASVNAAAQTVSQTIVNEAIASIPASASAVTDGLVHSPTPSWEGDAAFFCLRDEFYAITYDSVNQQVGDLCWHNVGIGGGNFTWFAGQGSLQPPPYLGSTVLGNNFGSNSGGRLLLPYTSTSGDCASYWPVFDWPGWKLSWVFAPCQMLNQTPQPYDSSLAFTTNFLPAARFYIGLGGAWRDANGSNSVARPWCFAGLRFDSDASIGDTTYHFECVANPIQDNLSSAGGNSTQGNVYDTGIAPKENTPMRLDMECTTAGSVTLTLSGGGQSATTSLAMPQYAPSGVGIGMGSITVSGNTAYPTLAWVTSGVANFRGGFSFGSGSIVAISGITGTYSGYNGTYQTIQAGGTCTLITPDPLNGSASSGSLGGSPVFSGYPALMPILSLCANTSTSGQLAVRTHFFSFVWNYGIASPSASTVSTSARYW